MVLDLEHELLRAARAFCAWREHVHRDAENAGFRCADVMAFIEQTGAHRAYPRIAHRLVAHVIDGLAESLVTAGLLERAAAGRYRLTEHAVASLDREPVYLTSSDPGAGEEAMTANDIGLQVNGRCRPS